MQYVQDLLSIMLALIEQDGKGCQAVSQWKKKWVSKR